MPYIYLKTDDLDQTDLVGSHQCVALVQHYAKAPHTSTWREGDKVKGNLTIRRGTAIATFVNGKYASNAHGNHAALYISQDVGGIWVMDQWKGDPKKPKVSKRYILFKGTWKDGSYADPSNNADAFSIIQ
ncbi:BPSL0067 family protein [Zoogloea sp. LCSB751]|uniref:BPSL0067 family protein n=1 Tax=Zoogloea sp. LCSB751 TaxID=1965277 RepID=UPI0009A4F98A|nr:BPSL0067 family protein [Zoogloea sp. LCSB751]